MEIQEQYGEKPQIPDRPRTGQPALDRRHWEALVCKLVQNVQELKEQNEILEKRMGQALAELDEKHRMVIVQGRYAAMGELIGNIAHQWRLPLYTLELLSQELSMRCEQGDCCRKTLKPNVEKARQTIQHMSQMMYNFRSFFIEDSERKSSRVLDVIAETLSLLEESFKAQQIRVRIESQRDPVVKCRPNEFSQVLLNILVNAKDTFSSQQTPDPTITLKVSSLDGKAVVTITDNAGGIPEDSLEEIFEPFHRAKGTGKVQGVGLYLAKTIVEKNLHGSLTVRNVENGAEFRIET